MRHLTAGIIGTWPDKYENLLVNAFLRVLGKSYLTLPCGISEEPTT